VSSPRQEGEDQEPSRARAPHPPSGQSPVSAGEGKDEALLRLESALACPFLRLRGTARRAEGGAFALRFRPSIPLCRREGLVDQPLRWRAGAVAGTCVQQTPPDTHALAWCHRASAASGRRLLTMGVLPCAASLFARLLPRSGDVLAAVGEKVTHSPQASAGSGCELEIPALNQHERIAIKTKSRRAAIRMRAFPATPDSGRRNRGSPAWRRRCRASLRF
jgi:hypothetical protein